VRTTCVERCCPFRAIFSFLPVLNGGLITVRNRHTSVLPILFWFTSAILYADSTVDHSLNAIAILSTYLRVDSTRYYGLDDPQCLPHRTGGKRCSCSYLAGISDYAWTRQTPPRRLCRRIERSQHQHNPYRDVACCCKLVPFFANGVLYTSFLCELTDRVV